MTQHSKRITLFIIGYLTLSFLPDWIAGLACLAALVFFLAYMRDDREKRERQCKEMTPVKVKVVASRNRYIAEIRAAYRFRLSYATFEFENGDRRELCYQSKVAPSNTIITGDEGMITYAADELGSWERLQP